MKKIVAILAFLPLLAIAQAPGAYVPCNGVDDTLPLQAALNVCKASPNGCRIWLDACIYKADALDATNLHGLELNCMPNTMLTAPNMTASFPMIDFTNSSNYVVRNCSWIHNTIIGGAHPPTAAILIAGQDRATFENITVNGPFPSGCVAIVGQSSVQFMGSFQLINWDTNAPCMNISNQSDWGIASKFASLPVTSHVDDVSFFGGEIHSMGRAPWTTYIRNATHIAFFGTLHDNSATAHVLMQGAVSYITSIGQKFYSELGTVSGSVWQCSGTCEHVRVRNAMYSPIPTTTSGSGTFLNYLND